MRDFIYRFFWLIFLLVLWASVGIVSCGITHAETVVEFTTLSNATMILYKQNMTGGMDMACTATLFEADGDRYKLLTAAHCVTEPNAENKLSITKRPLFVSLDEDNDKGFVRVSIERVGKVDNGYDFSILSVVTERKLTVVPLGDDKINKDGSTILMVSVPNGLGKTCFHGHIAKAVVDRPLEDENTHVNWQGSMLLQTTVAPGSSGSAIVSVEQGKIVGLLVGWYGGCVIGLPISRLSNTDKDNWLK